jgi:hypothetical protein
MAKVTKKQVVTEYTLTLTPDEATALVTMGGYIGGQPEGFRGDFANIVNALEAAGVQERADCVDDYHRSFYFTATK